MKQKAKSILTIGLLSAPLIFTQCNKKNPAGKLLTNPSQSPVEEVLDRDKDGVPDHLDAFPASPSASVDLDMDGKPEQWNAGFNPSEQKSSLTLDTNVELPKVGKSATKGKDQDQGSAHTKLSDLENNILEKRKKAIQYQLDILNEGRIHPEFSVANMLEKIDLDQPGLEEAKEYYQSKEIQNAAQSVLDYYKSKFQKDKIEYSGKPLNLKQQENYFHYFWGDDSQLIDRGVDYDWATDPAKHREWMIQHNREFGDIDLILEAYKKTGNPLFFNEIIARIVSYFEHAYPFDQSEGKYAYGLKHSFSNTMRGQRIGAILKELVNEEQFTVEMLAYFMNSLYYTFDLVSNNYAKHGNHLTYQLEHVMENGFRYKELKVASAKDTGWIDDSIHRTQKLLAKAVYPDGMNKELSPHYHGDYAYKFKKYYDLAKANNYEQAYSKEYKQLVDVTFDAYISMFLPDFRRVAFGDAWPRLSGNKDFKIRTQDPRHQYLASLGKQGTPFRNSKLDWGGYYALRSDWNFHPADKGIGLIMKNGGQAYWHNQPDNLTFELRAFGRTLVSDASQQRYSGDKDIMKMRAKYQQTRVHNTVTLDEKNTLFGARMNRWAEDIKGDNFSYDLLELENQSYNGLKHIRTVIFIDRQYFILIDKLEGKAKNGHLRAHFQLANENELDLNQKFESAHSVIDPENLRLYTTMPESGKRQGNLLIQGWSQPGIQLEDEMFGIGKDAKGAGFGIVKVNKPEFERRAAAFKLKRTAGPQYFVTALIPFQGDNSKNDLSPEVGIQFDPEQANLTLVVNGKSFSLKLPEANEFTMDTDGDGVLNIHDPSPYNKGK